MSEQNLPSEVGIPRTEPSAGRTTVSGLFGNPNKGVFVQTANSAGTLSNFGFHLAVHCRPEDD